MYTVIITHQVQSFDAWKAGYEADAARRAGVAIKRQTIGKLPGSPEQAVLILDLDDVAPLQGMLQDPSLMEIMKAAGVLAPPTVQVLESSETR